MLGLRGMWWLRGCGGSGRCGGSGGCGGTGVCGGSLGMWWLKEMWWLSWLEFHQTATQQFRVRSRHPSQSPEGRQEQWLCIRKKISGCKASIPEKFAGVQ
jgi:hypothetical protein